MWMGRQGEIDEAVGEGGEGLGGGGADALRK